VFRGRAFDRSAQQTIGGALFDFFYRAISSVFRALDNSPPLRHAAIWTGFGIIALIVARFLYVAAQQSQLSATGRAGRSARGAVADPWAAAQRAAADGRYTDAAHHLYAALLIAVAVRERLRLHPSKTAGDYARELRSRSSSASSQFRAFVRAFEFVAYGTRDCDRAQFEHLRALAEPMLGQRG
jgi:hypothetical protein